MDTIALCTMCEQETEIALRGDLSKYAGLDLPYQLCQRCFYDYVRSDPYDADGFRKKLSNKVILAAMPIPDKGN